MIGAPKVKPYKRKLRRHNDAIISLYSPNGMQGTKLISGSADHTFRVWDLQKKKIKRKHQLVRPTPAELEKLKLEHEEELEEEEENNQEEDKTDPGLSSEMVEKLFKEVEGTNQGVSAFCFVGKTIFTGYEDGLISMFNLRTGERQKVYIGHKGRINALIATADQHLYSASNDCSIRVWSTQEGDCECIYKVTHPVSSINIQVKEDSLEMFAGLWDKSVKQIDLKEKTIISTWQGLSEAVRTICVTDKYVFVGGSDPVIKAWDRKTMKCKEYIGHQGWVYALKVLDNMLFSGADDKTVKVWDIESTKLLDELIGHENGVTSLEFANGELFSGSYDRSIICWDVEEIKQQIEEREIMKEEEKLSQVLEEKMKTYKKPGKKGAPGKAAPGKKAAGGKKGKK